MTYAYDNYVQFPVADLYDTAMMQMAITAAKDLYDRGLKQIEDFYEKYGDFMSPFAKDMERYGQMMGGINDILNDAYSKGMDLTKTPEGRSLISRLVHSVSPQEFNMMRSNAKTGYAYLDAILKLRSQGKYSEALELFDIAQSGGINFNDFSTLGENGFNTWDRTSPIEAATLQELTRSAYANRTARLLSKEDFNDPRLRGKYIYDPKYEWSGYLYSDLLKGAPGAVLSASADSRMRYFRDLAEQKVASMGRPYTLADVDALFLRDVADANTWALIDPTRTANQYELASFNTLKKDWLAQRNSERSLNNALAVERFKAEHGGTGYGGSSRSRSNSGTGGTNGGKTPVSYYEPMYENLVTNTINNDPHRTYMFNNKEFSLDMGNSLYQSQQNIAEDYFGDGTVKSIYGNNTSTKGTSFGFNPKIKWDNGSAVLDMNPTTGSSRSTSIDINKTMRLDLTNSDAFKRKFNDNYNDYLNRMSLDFESGMFANSWNHGESKVSEVTQDGKTIEKLRGKNYVYMAPEDVDKVYSGKELAARASGATGKILEDAIAETKRIRNALKSGNIIMRGSGKMLGVGLYDTGLYGAYAKIHIANYDGADGLNSEQDAYIMTPYQSTPNPNFSKDGTFNLGFDQSYDLSRMNMDNAAIRKLGVSSNTGTIDNTLPDSNPWYTMDGLDSFDWPDDDDIE